MKISFKFKKQDFVDMLKKMAIPSQSSGEAFFQPVIFPRVSLEPVDGMRSEAMFEWIYKRELNIWVRFYCDWYEGLTNEPFRIPIDVQNVLKVLKTYTTIDDIYLFYNPDTGRQKIIGFRENVTKERELPIVAEKPGSRVHDAYPGQLEPGTEIVIFKKGKIKLNISGSCSANFLKGFFNSAKMFATKGEKEQGMIYNFLVREGQIKAFTNMENIKSGNVVLDTFDFDSIQGDGELHFNTLFEDTVGVLEGFFKFYTLQRGPMWIMQDTERTKVRYLIPPAAKGTYK